MEHIKPIPARRRRTPEVSAEAVGQTELLGNGFLRRSASKRAGSIAPSGSF